LFNLSRENKTIIPGRNQKDLKDGLIL